MTIIFTTCRFPYPLIGGDRAKSYHLLKHLAKNHTVHLVSHAEQGPLTKEQRAAMEQIGVIVHAVPFSKTQAILRSAFRIFSSQPLEISFYDSVELKNKVAELCALIRPDTVIGFFLRTAEATVAVNCRKIMIAEDCRVLYQTRSAAASSSPIQKIVRRFEVFKLKKYEPRMLARFDHITFVTETDLAAAKRSLPNICGSIVTCGVDLDVFKPGTTRRQKRLLFYGKLDVWANVLMARRTVKKILPLIEKKIPGICLDIVGGFPPRQVRSLAKQNITVTGLVPSVVPFLQQTGVFIHPHIGGSGIQNKLLEAMAAGCPSVTTISGAQGIPIEHGVHAYIAKNDAEVASYAIALLTDRVYADNMGKKARELMEQHFGWDAVAHSLDIILKKN